MPYVPCSRGGRGVCTCFHFWNWQRAPCMDDRLLGKPAPRLCFWTGTAKIHAVRRTFGPNRLHCITCIYVYIRYIHFAMFLQMNQTLNCYEVIPWVAWPPSSCFEHQSTKLGTFLPQNVLLVENSCFWSVSWDWRSFSFSRVVLLKNWSVCCTWNKIGLCCFCILKLFQILAFFSIDLWYCSPRNWLAPHWLETDTHCAGLSPCKRLKASLVLSTNLHTTLHGKTIAMEKSLSCNQWFARYNKSFLAMNEHGEVWYFM